MILYVVEVFNLFWKIVGRFLVGTGEFGNGKEIATFYSLAAWVLILDFYFSWGKSFESSVRKAK